MIPLLSQAATDRDPAASTLTSRRSTAVILVDPCRPGNARDAVPSPVVSSGAKASPFRCGFAGVHSATSARLELTVPRTRELLAVWAELIDGEARFRLGWGAESLTPPPDTDPMEIAADGVVFVGRDRRTGLAVVCLGLHRGDTGSFEAGGVVHPSFRRFGFGREALEVVCGFAHRHFGIAEVRAACETDNEAARRWLTSTGFTPIDGLATRTLPDGRTAPVLRWQHTDPTPHRHCRRANTPTA